MKLPRGFRLARTQGGFLVMQDPRNAPPLWHPRQPGVWEKGTFDVPADVPDERVQESAPKYRNRFGGVLESQGFRVLAIDGPHPDYGLLGQAITDPDRRRYIMWAYVQREPRVETVVDVPVAAVPALKAAGMKEI